MCYENSEERLLLAGKIRDDSMEEIAFKLCLDELGDVSFVKMQQQ